MQIKRHLPPFIRDVTLEDFQAVSGLTYIPQSGVINKKDPWNIFSLLSPSQIFSSITRGLQGVPKVSLSLDDSGALMVDLSEENDMYYDGRQIDLSDGTLDHGDVEVKSNKRNGIGKNLVRNYIELGLHLNCYGLNVLAGNTDGAYFWARIGVPLKSDLSKYDSLRRRLSERLEIIKNSVEPELYHHALKLIGLNDIYDINKIAQLNNEIGKNTQDVDEYLPLGQYLLSGLMYEGFLDFYDSVAMKTVEQTIGGFDLISLYFDDPSCDRREKPIALTA